MTVSENASIYTQAKAIILTSQLDCEQSSKVNPRLTHAREQQTAINEGVSPRKKGPIKSLIVTSFVILLAGADCTTKGGLQAVYIAAIESFSISFFMVNGKPEDAT